MSVAAPAWLWLLGAVAIPILLHLSRRRVARTIRIGSLRLLEGQPVPRAPTLRLVDRLRLVLRAAMIGSLAAGLAGVSVGLPRSGPSFALAHPAVAADPRFESDTVVARLRSRGTRFRLLWPGLPALDRALDVSGGRINAWALIQEAAATWPGTGRITVVAPALGGVVAGPRPAVSAEVQWYTPDWAALPDEVPSRLTVRRAVILGSGAGVGFIRAALEAIADLRGFRLSLLSPAELQSLEPGDLAVSPDSLPPTPAGVIRLDGGGLNDLLESPLAEAGLDPGFPSTIESRWLGEPSELALQPVTASQLAVERTGSESGETPAGTGRAWLLGALALFVAERLLAARRREALA